MDVHTDSQTPMDTDMECFTKAKAKNEPIFVLRAQDFTAAETVEFWIFANRDALGADHPKIVGAQAIVEQLKAWPKQRQAS